MEGEETGGEGEEGTGDEGTGDEGTGDEGTGDEGTGEEATGDAAAGQMIIDTTCKTCHVPGGLAKAVTLNAEAVSRLDTAITGANKANHTAFKDNFEGENRANLEAALKAIQ